MSVIESAAKAPLSKLLLDIPTLLDTYDQFRVSAMLCLISMRTEFLSPDLRAIQKSDHAWLRQYAFPPFHWRVWITRYTGDDSGAHWTRYCGIQISDDPTAEVGSSHCNTQVTTMVMGGLCAHVMCSTEWREFDGYEGIKLARIWPPNQIYLSTRFMPVISDEEVLWLHEALPRSLEPFLKLDQP
jgi:hypothetical protein